MHAETHTQTQQQQHTDEPTIFHYANTTDLKAGIPTIAVCGVRMHPGRDCIVRTDRSDSWVVCPICEFINAMSDDKPRFKRWLTGTYQLEKNTKEHNHE